MNTLITPEIRDIATEYYRKARVGFSNGIPLTVLHIADEYTIAVFGHENNQPSMIWTFPIGSEITARNYFRHNPPTPGEIEEAITIVEDEVMPIKKLLDHNSKLITLDSTIKDVAFQTETIDHALGLVLTIGNMEGVFNRLAAIITGRPASMDTLPTTLSFAASLLILREFMHHLGYTDITIRKDA
ncbi:MAG: hypothetical protein Q8928_18390 [Bacteroidota bacterium]|nr:hypothetical protein [Bacteroidota bacterium]